MHVSGICYVDESILEKKSFGSNLFTTWLSESFRISNRPIQKTMNPKSTSVRGCGPSGTHVWLESRRKTTKKSLLRSKIERDWDSKIFCACACACDSVTECSGT